MNQRAVLYITVAGIGNFEEVEAASSVINLADFDVMVISGKGLISSKRAFGQPKDLPVLPELEALLELQNEEKEETNN
jgi:hypothetical protein